MDVVDVVADVVADVVLFCSPWKFTWISKFPIPQQPIDSHTHVMIGGGKDRGRKARDCLCMLSRTLPTSLIGF